MQCVVCVCCCRLVETRTYTAISMGVLLFLPSLCVPGVRLPARVRLLVRCPRPVQQTVVGQVPAPRPVATRLRRAAHPPVRSHRRPPCSRLACGRGHHGARPRRGRALGRGRRSRVPRPLSPPRVVRKPRGQGQDQDQDQGQDQGRGQGQDQDQDQGHARHATRARSLPSGRWSHAPTGPGRRAAGTARSVDTQTNTCRRADALPCGPS